MKLSIAQTRPFKGDIPKNIEVHKKLIYLAVADKADIIVFPELSLTGYEPILAKSLASSADDSIFDDFQKISDAEHITICLGMPTLKGSDILISMLIFQANKPRQCYSKQYLHEDEFPYFVNGNEQVILTLNDTKIAPAICYESLLPEHSGNAFESGAEIYIASVAKSAKGVEKAFNHYPDIAKKYTMTVLMSNCVGYCDNFEGAGQSALWNSRGELVGRMNDKDEGILIFDTETGELIERTNT